MDFKEHFKKTKNQIDDFILKYLGGMESSMGKVGLRELHKAIAYTLADGGHRIRPILSMFTAETLNKDPKEVLPFGAAVEFIHSYSLIHDDLPCMDDDDERRGKPSNHKTFGEGLAILSGDALNTEAFFLLTQNYGANPQLALDLVSDLALASGVQGMVGGQAADVVLKGRDVDGAEMEFLHTYKTGALFRASIQGAARICGANGFELKCLSDYARAFGLIFQITDDISDEKTSDEPSFVKAVGIDQAKETCKQLVAQAHEALKSFEGRADGLRNLVIYLDERA